MVKGFKQFLTNKSTTVHYTLPITRFYRMFKDRNAAMSDASGEPGRKAAELEAQGNVRILLHRKDPDKYRDIWKNDVHYIGTFVQFRGDRLTNAGPYAEWSVQIIGPAYVIKMITNARPSR